jgi:SAM-dependent methyltransferase
MDAMNIENNDIVIEAWNTVLFEKLTRYKHLVTALSSHSDAAIRRHPPASNARVLDVGSGFGDSAIRIAQEAGPGGEVFGVDCARNMVDTATDDAKAAGVNNVSFFAADAQLDDLRGPYDYAFSRFGTMFFMSPGAALGNIRRSLKPGGKFAQVVWRIREDNPWLFEAEQRVREIVPVISHEETDEVHCGPGPFSMADADMVSSMLCGVGYEDITFERFDDDIWIGKDIDDAVEFAMDLGPAGEIIRLAGEEGEKLRPAVIAALEDVLKPYLRDKGVWAPSSAWFITARNPA